VTYRALPAPVESVTICELCGATVPAGSPDDPVLSEETWKLRHDRSHAEQAETYLQVQILTEQMNAVRESQKREDTDAHRTLRRSILALALAEVVASINRGLRSLDRPATDVDDWTEADWEDACAEVYRRYGGPPLNLWKNPPDHVSDETKALVKAQIERWQETR
jgi:hypothetical protein